MGGKGRGRASKGICCCDRIVVIWEFSFFLLPNKTEWALVYSPEPVCLHSAASFTDCTNELDLQTREIPYGVTRPIRNTSQFLGLHVRATDACTSPWMSDAPHQSTDAYKLHAEGTNTHTDKKERRTDIATTRPKRPKGRFSEKGKGLHCGFNHQKKKTIQKCLQSVGNNTEVF